MARQRRLTKAICCVPTTLQELYSYDDLYWSGTEFLPAFLVASRRQPPHMLPELPPGKSYEAACEEAVTAAKATLPWPLLLPVKVLLQQQCDAALQQQRAVYAGGDDDSSEGLKCAEQHVMGLGQELEPARLMPAMLW